MMALRPMHSSLSIPTQPGAPAHTLARVSWIAFGIFLIAAGAALLGECVPWPLKIRAAAEMALLLAATTTTLISLSRRLPLQNVLFIAGTIALAGGTIHAVGMQTGISLGPFEPGRPEAHGMTAFRSWTIPLLWIVALLNSRGAAKSLMQRWRSGANYGFWLFGLTILLALVFDLAFEPMVWRAAPVIHLAGGLVTTAVVLLIATPFLINKKPVAERPEYDSLATWSLLLIYFAVVSLP